jgi:hypothetical protein
MRLLLVAGGADRSDPLGQALAREGFAVKVAPEGWYALTMLEREPAALVLVVGADGEPPAAELAAIVRADRDLANVALAVVVGPSEPVPEGFALVLDAGWTPSRSAAVLRRLARDRGPRDSLVLSGSLDALDLLHLCGTLSHCRRTGRLSLLVPGDAVGEIYFDQGQVVHARFGALEGRAAFSGLFASARRHPEVGFEFEVLTREEVFRYPRTVETEVQTLLLSMAPALDERRAAAGSRNGAGAR